MRDVVTTLEQLKVYAKEQSLPWYCQRGQAVRELAADYDAGRPVPEWVRDAMKKRRTK